MDDLRKTLSNFLEIIDYLGNREEFVEKLLNSIYLQSLNDLIQTLSNEKREIVLQSLESVKSPELLSKAVNLNFDQQKVNQSLINNTQKIFTEYLQTIEEDLTEDQKVKLKQYFSSKASSKMA